MCAAKRLKMRVENYSRPIGQHVTEPTQRMPAGLKRAAERSRNTYVATEVTDGNRTLFVVRGTVIVERWQGCIGGSERSRRHRRTAQLTAA